MPQGRCAHGSWECGGGRLDDASLPEFRRTGRRNQKTARGIGRDSRQSQEEVLQSGSYGCRRGLEVAARPLAFILSISQLASPASIFNLYAKYPRTI